MLLSSDLLTAQAAIFKALGHPARLRMVDALRAGELCVCDLRALVGTDLSTVSRHLAVLRGTGLVTARKQGNAVYYALALRCLDTFLACTAEHLRPRMLTR